MIRLACFLLLVGSLWAQEAPTGMPVDPSMEEQQALKRISGQIQGKIVWSTSRANSKHDIWIMNADGTGAKALTKSNQVDWFPRFSPDGSKVIFNRSKSGWVPENDANYPEKWDIWQIDSDGTNEQKIISNATWATYRPDGKAIIFSRAAQVFSFDIATKKETLLDKIEVEAGQTSLGCTSFYMDAGFDPLFPFGYGLSYTTFQYNNLKLSATEFTPKDQIEVTFDLKNTGKYEGTEVAQLYVRDKVGSVTRPVKELKRFTRVTLKPGETKNISFALPVEELAFWNINMKKVVEPGDFTLWVGTNSQEGISADFKVVE